MVLQSITRTTGSLWRLQDTQPLSYTVKGVDFFSALFFFFFFLRNGKVGNTEQGVFGIYLVGEPSENRMFGFM